MAIKPIDFYDQLANCGIEFFTGVPDSLLKEFCLCIDAHVPQNNHIIAANEGNAIALAVGFFLAKKTLPIVYMQNSGLGNAINPLLSLCDPDVYAIPMVLMVGWRGEPGFMDEPHHGRAAQDHCFNYIYFCFYYLYICTIYPSAPVCKLGNSAITFE